MEVFMFALLSAGVLLQFAWIAFLVVELVREIMRRRRGAERGDPRILRRSLPLFVASAVTFGAGQLLLALRY